VPVQATNLHVQQMESAFEAPTDVMEGMTAETGVMNCTAVPVQATNLHVQMESAFKAHGDVMEQMTAETGLMNRAAMVTVTAPQLHVEMEDALAGTRIVMVPVKTTHLHVQMESAFGALGDVMETMTAETGVMNRTAINRWQ